MSTVVTDLLKTVELYDGRPYNQKGTILSDGIHILSSNRFHKTEICNELHALFSVCFFFLLVSVFVNVALLGILINVLYML